MLVDDFRDGGLEAICKKLLSVMPSRSRLASRAIRCASHVIRYDKIIGLSPSPCPRVPPASWRQVWQLGIDYWRVSWRKNCFCKLLYYDIHCEYVDKCMMAIISTAPRITLIIRLTQCSLVTTLGASTWVSIGLDNGLVPDGTTPLPEPMLTYRQRCYVVFTWKVFRCLSSFTRSVHKLDS